MVFLGRTFQTETLPGMGCVNFFVSVLFRLSGRRENRTVRDPKTCLIASRRGLYG